LAGKTLKGGERERVIDNVTRQKIKRKKGREKATEPMGEKIERGTLGARGSRHVDEWGTHQTH
jgi:hypothetical protein